MNMNKKIEELEAKVIAADMSHSVPGTVLSRALLDAVSAKKRGLKVPKDRQEVLVWSIGIGGLNASKTYFYGNTIAHAVQRAEKFVAQRKREFVGTKKGRKAA